MMDVNNFKQINDQMGHTGGDILLKQIARIILKNYSKYGFCYRICGDEFCVILKPWVLEKFSNNETIASYSKLLDSLNNKFDELILAKCEDYPSLKYGVSKGYSIFFGESNQSFFYENDSEYVSSIQMAINIADQKLYEDKKENS